MYGPVLGASTTTTAILALPNTGGNRLLELSLIGVIILGVSVTIIGLARLNAAKSK